MLAWLSIQGLALVDSVELSFDRALNVLTGETGAGKSLVLGSIGLLLGERADVAWLRAGEPRGSVEGTFDLGGRPELAEALRALGVEPEEERIVLRREIYPDGKSRAFLNGRSVLISQLKAVGDRLVDLHGQHEHQLLLRPESQADFFDGWAGLLEERGALEGERAALLGERQSLRDSRDRWEHDRAEEASIREDHRELQDASLDALEEERLLQDRERLRNREKILRALSEARQAIAGDEVGAATSVHRSARLLRAVAAIDAESEGLAEEAERVLGTLRELDARLERAESRLEEPLDLEALESRLDVLRRLKRKHGADLPGLIALRDGLEVKVRAFDPSGRDLERVERAHADRLHAFEQRLDAFAARRFDRFPEFAREVGSRLQRLGFGRASLRVRPAERDRSRAVIDPSAMPTLEFAFQPNPGEPDRPLRRIASGGELSRVMLAIKSLMAERDQVAVLVFDEVDQGIGGAVGEEVGRLLRALGRRRQVICITHLPLIAAHGTLHFEVRKTVQGGRTITSVRALRAEEREVEVARLLAGDRVTTTTRRQARELLEAAARDAEKPAGRPRRTATRSA